MSISKLTSDYPINVLFSANSFEIQNRKIGIPMAKGRCEHDLYILERGQAALITTLKGSKVRGSFELWHRCLGHTTFDLIAL